MKLENLITPIAFFILIISTFLFIGLSELVFADTTVIPQPHIAEIEHKGHTYLYVVINSDIAGKTLTHSESCVCKE